MSEKARSAIERYVIPALLAAALIAAALWASRQKALADGYRNAAREMCVRAHGELTDDFYDLEAALSKLMAANSPAQYMLLLDDVWRLSGSAVSNMSHLPLSHVDTAEINQFAVRLGDYAHALTLKVARGGVMTPEDCETIAQLRDSCAGLAAEYGERHAAGDIPEELGEGGYFGDSGTKDREGINKFPTLIYDGPFSESSEKLPARGLGDGEADQAAAETAAEAAAGLDLSYTGMSEGKIPAYNFSAAAEDGSWAEAAVARQGGRLLWYMRSCAGEKEGRPPEEEAGRYREAALKKLRELGYEGMTATYAQYYGGTALINCAATQDGVILYSDLVKVWIDRETYEACGVDARDYLFSHVPRQIGEPAVSQGEAEEMLSPNLTVRGRALALIPVTPETEKLCHEFKCTLGEDFYIVYVNAQSGEEERIFKVIDSEDGDLVI